MASAKHIEFFDRDHFENFYHRVKAKASINPYIDFFWEFKFDDLWKTHPKGFQDILFPDLGYTYMINMGTPFVMHLNEEKYKVQSDSFIPRSKNISCWHTPGNRIFGIKFKVSPVIFQKEINFSEYKDYVFPLSYLIDRNVVSCVKNAASFIERANIITAYYEKIITENAGKVKKVSIVTSILKQWYEDNNFSLLIKDIAAINAISERTLQRYFEITVGINCKRAQQLARVRKAIYHFIYAPETFNFSHYNYYDSSHFYRHAKQFFHNHTNADITITLQTRFQLRHVQRMSKKPTNFLLPKTV
jgi:AraC-like DNA-binding protein